MLKRSNGEHFKLKKSIGSALHVPEVNGRHFMFKRSIGSAFHVHEMQWVSVLYSMRSTGWALHIQEVKCSSLHVQEVQCVSTSCSWDAWVSNLCSKRSIGSALHVQEVKWSSLHVPEIQWVNTSCWRGQMVVASCSRNPEIHEFEWPSTLYSRYPVVRNSCFRCSVGQHFRFESWNDPKKSSGQHFLSKKSSGQHFVYKGLSGHNFMFKRPYDQRFMLKRSSVQHVNFKRSSDRHWNGISAFRPVICVVCLRAAVEILRYHTHSSSMDLASSVFRTNFTARHKKIGKNKYVKILLRFLTFFVCSF